MSAAQRRAASAPRARVRAPAEPAGGGCRGEGSPEASTAAAGARARGEGNTYRVPFMETGDLPCGFEVGFMLDAFYLKFQTVVHTADVFQLVFLGLFVHAAVRGELALSR